MTYFCSYLTSEPLNVEPLNQALFKELNRAKIYHTTFVTYLWDMTLVSV
jgi:hypothetical protein